MESMIRDAQVRFRVKSLKAQLILSNLSEIGPQTPRPYPYLHDHRQLTQWPTDKLFNTT